MKNKKWLTYTFGVLLTLIVLVAVGGAGFRIGLMQSASFAPLQNGQSAQMPFPHHGHDMEGNFNQMERGNSSHGFDCGRGGFSPIFGLLHLVVVGALGWFGYKLIKNSGWKLAKTNTSAAPAVEQPSAAADDEKKETE